MPVNSFMNPPAKHTQPLALLLQEDNAAERSPIMTVITPVMLVCSTFQG